MMNMNKGRAISLKYETVNFLLKQHWWIKRAAGSEDSVVFLSLSKIVSRFFLLLHQRGAVSSAELLRHNIASNCPLLLLSSR